MTVSIKIKDLPKLKNFVDKDQDRLSNILFAIREGSAWLYATNGYIAIKIKVEVNFSFLNNVRVILPLEFFNLLSKANKNKNVTIGLDITDSIITLSSNDLSYIYERTDITYPDVEQFFISQNIKSVTKGDVSTFILESNLLYNLLSSFSTILRKTKLRRLKFVIPDNSLKPIIITPKDLTEITFLIMRMEGE